MKVKIEGNDTVGGTRITTESGEDISNMVNEINYREVAGRPPEVELSLFFIDFTTTTEARMIGPSGKAVARVIYTDGSEDVFEEDGQRAVARPMLDGRVRHFKDPK